MLQGRLLIAVVVLVSAAFADDTVGRRPAAPATKPPPAKRLAAQPETKRPTADEVSTAVAWSRAHYAEANPVPTKQQKLAAIQKEINDTQASMRRLTGTQAARKVEDLYRKVRSLKAEHARVRRKYAPERIVRLAEFTRKELKIGGVGRINDKADEQAVYCVKTLEGDTMLAYIEPQMKTDENKSDEDNRAPAKSPTFLLQGANAAAATEGQPITGAFDVVVTGKRNVEDEQGRTQSVFVLEVFDPDRPFSG